MPNRRIYSWSHCREDIREDDQHNDCSDDHDATTGSPRSSAGSEMRANPDKLLESFGWAGRFQMFGHFLCNVLNFMYSGSLLVVTFTSEIPKTECQGDNGTMIEDACYSDKCLPNTTIVKDTAPVGSLLYDYGKQCLPTIWAEAGSWVYVVGAMCLVPVFSHFADRYGRRPVLLATLYSSVILNLLVPLSPHYVVYVILRFFIGATSDSYLAISALMTVELISSEARPIISLVQTVSWALGIMWIGLLSFYIPSWRMMYALVVAPGLLTVFYYCFLTETPYWMIAHGKEKELQRYVERANKMNGTCVEVIDCCEEKETLTEKHVNFCTVLRSAKMHKIIWINGCVQFALSVSYYSISFMANHFTKRHGSMGFLILAAMEIPGGIAVVPLMKWFGRRSNTSVSLILQAVALGAVPFVAWSEPAVVTLLSIAKICNSVGFAVHPVLAAEMIPTCVRSIAASLINIPQSLGMLVGPFFKHFHQKHPTPAFASLAVVSLIAGFSILFLRETKGMDLPTDLNDLDKISERKASARKRREEAKMFKSQSQLVSGSSERALLSSESNECVDSTTSSASNND